MGNKPGNTIDLLSLDTAEACDRGAEIELLHPTTKKPLGQFVSIVGKDSKVFRDNVAAFGKRRADHAALHRGRQSEATTVEKDDAQNTELLVNCTTGFRNINLGGTELPFNRENCAKLYSIIFIRDQINLAIGDLENFMPG
jgi:hypothetical protein